jgi:hypothetical protein
MSWIAHQVVAIPIEARHAELRRLEAQGLHVDLIDNEVGQ